MAAEYLVTVPDNIIRSDLNIEFYENIKVVECRAESMLEIYYQYPNAIRVDVKAGN